VTGVHLDSLTIHQLYKGLYYHPAKTSITPAARGPVSPSKIDIIYSRARHRRGIGTFRGVTNGQQNIASQPSSTPAYVYTISNGKMV